MATRVVLDIFSGRPNPEWTLSPEQERELQVRLAALRPTTLQPPSSPPSLGYRGLKVVAETGGKTRELILFIGVNEPKRNKTWDDPGRELERWLLQVARPALPEEQRAVLEQIVF